MKLPSYHRPKKKLGGPWALSPWAQEKNFGGPGPWVHGLKRKTLGALGPSDLSLMALALFFSCIPCSGSLFCPFPNGPGPRPLAFLLCYNPCRPPGLIWPNTWGPNPDSKLAKRRDHHEKIRDGNALHCKDCYSSLLFFFYAHSTDSHSLASLSVTRDGLARHSSAHKGG